MQIFWPEKTFDESAKALDDTRLNKQIIGLGQMEKINHIWAASKNRNGPCWLSQEISRKNWRRVPGLKIKTSGGAYIEKVRHPTKPKRNRTKASIRFINFE